MENNKKYYIYKITLLKGSLAGKYYFGKRHLKKDQNNPMTDGYYGSGTIVKKYYKKYPFKQGVTAIKEILELNDTEEENSKREIFYIGDKYETDPDCLNLKSGGFGGALSKSSIEKISKSHIGIKPWNKGMKLSDEYKKKLSDAHKGHKLTEGQKKKIADSNKGRVFSEASKHKISKSKEQPILVFTYKTNEYVGCWGSALVASQELGVHKSMISMIIHGKRKQAKGLIFKKAG